MGRVEFDGYRMYVNAVSCLVRRIDGENRYGG